MDELSDVARLQTTLKQLQRKVLSAESPAGLATEPTLETLYQQLQQAFGRGQFLPAQQPYVTEFHKQLRLLGNDLMFLKSARQPATRAQRLQTIGDRLRALQGYSEAIARST